MVLSVIKWTMLPFLGDSKSQRASKSHYWFKSYGEFAEWVNFAYWWSFIGKGVPAQQDCFKGTQGFICCSFKVAFSATLNKQIMSSLATYDALSLVNHRAHLHLIWLHIVDIFTALVNSW